MEDWNVSLVMILVQHEKGLIHKMIYKMYISVRDVSLYLLVGAILFEILPKESQGCERWLLVDDKCQ